MRENEKKERVLFALTQVDDGDGIDKAYLKKNKLQESEIRHA